MAAAAVEEAFGRTWESGPPRENAMMNTDTELANDGVKQMLSDESTEAD